MSRPRVIPVLLMRGSGLYKTERFAKPVYVGDPINTVRIFNDKEVDELILLDTLATIENKEPDFERIKDIVSESFMPLAYGGGITRLEQAMRLFELGVEKVILGTAAFRTPELITAIASKAGSQAVVISIDVQKPLLGANQVFVECGKKRTGIDPVTYAKNMVARGAGEIMLTSIANEGGMKGYDIDLTAAVAREVDVPIIAHGGAGTFGDFAKAMQQGHASAVAAGSLFVFQGPHRAVLISYPSPHDIKALESQAA